MRKAHYVLDRSGEYQVMENRGDHVATVAKFSRTPDGLTCASAHMDYMNATVRGHPLPWHVGRDTLGHEAIVDGNGRLVPRRTFK